MFGANRTTLCCCVWMPKRLKWRVSKASPDVPNSSSACCCCFGFFFVRLSVVIISFQEIYIAPETTFFGVLAHTHTQRNVFTQTTHVHRRLKFARIQSCSRESFIRNAWLLCGGFVQSHRKWWNMRIHWTLPYLAHTLTHVLYTYRIASPSRQQHQFASINAVYSHSPENGFKQHVRPLIV